MFVVRLLSLVVRCSLRVVRCSSIVACDLMFVVWCLVCVAFKCCLLVVAWYLVFGSSLFVVWCWLCAVCCLFSVYCCSLFVFAPFF